MKAAGAVFVVKNPPPPFQKKGTFPLVPARLRRLKLVCVVARGPGHMAVRLLHL